MRRVTVASFWVVLTCACDSASEVFVQRVWGETESAILVAVHPEGARTPIVVPASAGVRRATLQADDDVTFYAQTFDELADRDVGACLVTVGPNGDLPLGAPSRSWVGRRDGDAIRFTLEEDPRDFDLRIQGCERPVGRCDLEVELLDGGPTQHTLFATAVVNDDRALFAGGARGLEDGRTLTMRYDRGTVDTLAPSPQLLGRVRAMEFDGTRILAAQGTTLFELDQRGAVTASIAVGFEIMSMEAGRDGTTFILSPEGALAIVEPGRLDPTPFPTPRYGDVASDNDPALDVVDAGELVVLGPDGSLWRYAEERWSRLLELVDGLTVATDGRDVLVARDNAPVILNRIGRPDWDAISTTFNHQNALHSEALGDGRFVVGGQAGTLIYYDGATACTVPSATDRNIEDFDLSPSGDFAFAVGEHYRTVERATLLMRWTIPSGD